MTLKGTDTKFGTTSSLFDGTGDRISWQSAYAAYRLLLPKWRRRFWPWLSKSEKEEAILLAGLVATKGKERVSKDMQGLMQLRDLTAKKALAELVHDKRYWESKHE